jgi:hypothetical protein
VRGRAAIATLVAVLGFIFMAGPRVPVAAGTEGKIEPAILRRLERSGVDTFWVELRARPDLSPAVGMEDWTARGAFVADRLRAVAESSQWDLLRYLREHGVAFVPFWITNAIRVTAGRSIVEAVAARPEVLRLRSDRTFTPPAVSLDRTAEATEWNIHRIRADRVWRELGVRGRGAIVASIDTGVDFRHPALVRRYRGFTGVGFDHNYNWFDPAGACDPPTAPCDNVDRGTHIMGTMVGEDPGKSNQIGVAPRARWIAAKGCEDVSCSIFALLSSGQWMLAPTDLNGENPRPDLRPHVIASTWGMGPGDPFYQDIVDAWVASGIFPVFPVGGGGPACATVGSPADYRNTYAVGAFDMSNRIASFSGRGPSVYGVTKPDVAAPGVNIRSSVPGGTYSIFSGTSMATPHVAGTVALIWSANPDLIGNLPMTARLLDDSAIDVEDLRCGGTTDDNNVWGEGGLDAFAAVKAAVVGAPGQGR